MAKKTKSAPRSAKNKLARTPKRKRTPSPKTPKNTAA